MFAIFFANCSFYSGLCAEIMNIVCRYIGFAIPTLVSIQKNYCTHQFA